MKVVCRQGHFAFYPADKGEVIRFQRLFKLGLVAERDYFTFDGLEGLPRWSQAGRLFGTLPAVVTFEGEHAWEVMRENAFVYSLATGFLVPSSTVVQSVNLRQTLDSALAPKPLIQPGAVMTDGNILLGYRGELDLTSQRLYVFSLETLL